MNCKAPSDVSSNSDLPSRSQSHYSMQLLVFQDTIYIGCKLLSRLHLLQLQSA
jgi:hypothetical protein